MVTFPAWVQVNRPVNILDCWSMGYNWYIEDITWPRVDMNFIFECSTWYLTSECSEWVRYRVEHEKIKFISTTGHVIFCLLYKHWINSCEKGAIYYVTITMVISSRVKITCYLHLWRYEVFAGKLTWYFTGVYIIIVYTTQVNSTFRTHWLTSSEVISQVLFTSEQPKKNKLAFVAIF